MNHPFTFSKKEHLCGEKRSTRLFTQGKAFIVHPLRVVYIVNEQVETEPALVMVSVPKKRFKRAVKRNRLKRLMREAYRLNKTIFVDALKEHHRCMHVSFNYISNDEVDFETMQKKMKLALFKLTELIPPKETTEV